MGLKPCFDHLVVAPGNRNTIMHKILIDQLTKLSLLKERGIDPFPSSSSRTHDIIDFLDCFQDLLKLDNTIILVGRILALRRQGGIVFVDIFDGTDRAQIVIQKEEVSEGSLGLFLEAVSPSDFIEVEGVAFVTTRGVNSLLVKKWKMLAKSLRQIPDQRIGLRNEDEKLRKRYLDILLNPEISTLIKKRSVFWNSIRTFMLNRGFVEVETPILETSPVGAKARQFVTHSNALDHDMYLRISPELWHKRLLIGGIPKVFEIGRVFRNEGMSYEHAQDFTAFEFYESYASAIDGIPMLIDLFRQVAIDTFGTRKFVIQGFEVDLGANWEILDFNKLLQERYSIDPLHTTIEEIRERLDIVNIKYEADIDINQGIGIFWKHIQKTLGGPVLVTKIPYSFVPLGKRSFEDSRVMEEFKIIIGGSEVGHAFNELNDPIDQRVRFSEQQDIISASITNSELADDDFIEALEYGMPPAFGLGLSERLFSFLAGTPIRTAQAFPLMKPETIQSKPKSISTLTQFSDQAIVANLSSIASGLTGQPTNNVQLSEDLFRKEMDLINFSKCHAALVGTFDRHYWASIPYVFEEECRLGVGIMKYASLKHTTTNPLTLWCLGMAEATLARTLSELGKGAIVSFANTGSEANEKSFLAHGQPRHAYLHIGFYQDVTKSLIQKYNNVFSDGFDIIIEDTTFQMLGRDRLSQIKQVKKNLKNNGILILTEKFNGDDYDYWETLKDRDFKSFYFSQESIESKRQYVLSEMKKNQVSIPELADICSGLFEAGSIFWNSGNFYSIALSNSSENLARFIAALPDTCIPNRFSRNTDIVAFFDAP
jgi:lysyl-tRNA synthetase class 2